MVVAALPLAPYSGQWRTTGSSRSISPRSAWMWSAVTSTPLVTEKTWNRVSGSTGRPVDPDTLFHVFSVTKGVLVTALHIQAERGLIDLDDPVVRHWPEYGANGKAATTIRHVLQHRSGLPMM